MFTVQFFTSFSSTPHMSVCFYVCLFVPLSSSVFCLSVSLSASHFNGQHVYLYVYLSVYVSVYLSVAVYKGIFFIYSLTVNYSKYPSSIVQVNPSTPYRTKQAKEHVIY